MCYGTSGERGKGRAEGGYSFQNRYFFRLLVYKGVEIIRVEVYERVGKSLSSFKEPLIKIYQTETPCGCIISFFRENIKTVRRPSYFGDLFILPASYESL